MIYKRDVTVVSVAGRGDKLVHIEEKDFCAHETVKATLQELIGLHLEEVQAGEKALFSVSRRSSWSPVGAS